MLTVDLPAPARALAIGAHPDDVEFGCGATLAKWAAAGCEVHLLVCTDGSKGTWDGGADPGELVRTRAAEQQAAAAVLGAREVHFLGRVDGELHEDLAGRAAVCRVIREVRPDVLLAHDPWRRHRMHPDHRHAGFLAIDGAVAARDPHFFPDQGLAPHRPAAALLFEADAVDHVEEVSATLGAKIEALLAHRSQWRSTMGIADDDADAGRERFARRIIDAAQASGLRAGLRAGEAFHRVRGL